jgi:DNA gyrase subunit A
VETVFTSSTHDNILFFTNLGKVYVRKGYRIPRAERSAKGTNIVNILPLENGEKVATMIHSRQLDEDKYVVMITKNGTVKRMHEGVLRNIRKSGIRAIVLSEDDELISVRQTDGEQSVFLATRDGQAIRFHETDLRPMGRTAAGVRGIRLRAGDVVVGAGISGGGDTLLSVTENGYGKRTSQNEYKIQKRGGSGLKNYNVTAKTGKVCDVKMVNEQDDLLVVSDDGTIIRMAVSDISILGRATQGVRVKVMTDDSKVISIARLDPEPEEEAQELEEVTEATEAAPESEETP